MQLHSLSHILYWLMKIVNLRDVSKAFDDVDHTTLCRKLEFHRYAWISAKMV